jgi:predicted nucleic acid-binding protein
MVVFDSSFLLMLLNPNAGIPLDPATGQIIDKAKERINYLISRLDKDGTKIIVPTPALAEVLVHAGTAGPDYLQILNESAVFRIEPFDERAAVEVAAMTAKVIRGGRKLLGFDEPWQKIKVDFQIIAIARVCGATALYSEDKKMGNKAEGMTVIKLHQLPLPPEDTQVDMFSYAKSVDDAPEERTD